ncbi:glutamine amidotransferase [Bordetella parapertussis]|uniref:Probable class-I glutamine amidotransferase n=1 Tax=Bordetella parapertussis (strain Bpp5) TaxID=1208660 RepID=K0MIX8_BORPB|nr:glutamine amidotransferase [Bordetella parapertussis]CCJ49789.1 probable class-I glutamine amidotransferase [Bordetella parapertussis Bpp5]
MTAALPVLILHTGNPAAALRAAHGSYAEMLRQAAGLDAAGTHVVASYKDEAPRAPGAYRAALITGSPAMVTDRAPWSEAAAGAGLPMFGICYGHQLLAHALGGVVGDNPAGRELGTLPVELLPAAATDPLLAGLPAAFDAQMMHEQAVLAAPPGAAVLARSAQDAHQMLRLAPRIYTAQFHPEFTPGFVAAHLRHHAALYAAHGLDVEGLARAAGPTPLAASLVRRFLACCA